MLFLGDVPDPTVPALSTDLAEAVAPFPPFTLRLQGVGVFPNVDRPRVAWVGVGLGAEALGQLHDALAPVARRHGITIDGRPFTPHLTLFRVRRPSDADRARALVDRYRMQEFGATEVRELLLKSSDLRAAGPVHRTVAALPLGGPRMTP